MRFGRGKPCRRRTLTNPQAGLFAAIAAGVGVVPVASSTYFLSLLAVLASQVGGGVRFLYLRGVEGTLPACSARPVVLSFFFPPHNYL